MQQQILGFLILSYGIVGVSSNLLNHYGSKKNWNATFKDIYQILPIFFDKHLFNKVLLSYAFCYRYYEPKFAIMLQKYISIFLLFITISSCHIVQRRSGKVKYINTGEVLKGDSMLLVPLNFSWNIYLVRDSARRNFPSKYDFDFTENWEKHQINVLRNYFFVNPLEFGNPDSLYKRRRRDTSLILGYPTLTSNLVSYKYIQFVHGINGNQLDEAFSFLPDTILKLSDSLPILILTNYYGFFIGQFMAGYAEGSTGLVFSPDMHCAIIKNRKVVYYRNYDKKFSYRRFMRNGFTEKVTHKLFDKLE